MAGKTSHDITYHWTRGEKTGWTTIGHAFTESDGSIKLYFNATPISEIATYPGEYKLYPKKG